MFRLPFARLTAALIGAAALLPCLAAGVDIVMLRPDGKPAADGAVFLESKDMRAAAKPATGVEIEQAAKRFTNRVTVVPVGTEVLFPNRDKVRHHVYSFSPAKTFELKLYSGTPSNPVVFDKAGIAVLGCNIHDNMVAWVVVVETPYYGVADAGGRVRLENVPAGSYRLRWWHPELPPGAPALEQPLVVSAAGGAVELRLPAGAGH